MTIGKEPKPNMSKYEIGMTFQVRKEGVSSDYRNNFLGCIVFCKALLGYHGFDLSKSGYTEEEARLRILKKIISFPSYTEYMEEKDKINGIGLVDFLTPKGKEIVARLDQITLKLKSFYVEDPQALEIQQILSLLKEGGNLISNQESLSL